MASRPGAVHLGPYPSSSQPTARLAATALDTRIAIVFAVTSVVYHSRRVPGSAGARPPLTTRGGHGLDAGRPLHDELS